jgi:monoamine oxidase
MVLKLQHQLSVLHGGKEVPKPIFGICMDWGTVLDIGGGWHSWEVNQKGAEVAKAMEQPIGGDEELYTCGEAYSQEQGWVEGALKSTERVLKRLKVPPPSWFPGTDLDEYIQG